MRRGDESSEFVPDDVAGEQIPIKSSGEAKLPSSLRSEKMPMEGRLRLLFPAPRGSGSGRQRWWEGGLDR